MYSCFIPFKYISLCFTIVKTYKMQNIELNQTILLYVSTQLCNTLKEAMAYILWRPQRIMYTYLYTAAVIVLIKLLMLTWPRTRKLRNVCNDSFSYVSLGFQDSIGTYLQLKMHQFFANRSENAIIFCEFFRNSRKLV